MRRARSDVRSWLPNAYMPCLRRNGNARFTRRVLRRNEKAGISLHDPPIRMPCRDVVFSGYHISSVSDFKQEVPEHCCLCKKGQKVATVAHKSAL